MDKINLEIKIKLICHLLAKHVTSSSFSSFEGEAAHTIKYHFIGRKFLRALADYPSI